jgi:hypothetical protein
MPLSCNGILSSIWILSLWIAIGETQLILTLTKKMKLVIPLMGIIRIIFSKGIRELEMDVERRRPNENIA